MSSRLTSVAGENFPSGWLTDLVVAGEAKGGLVCGAEHLCGGRLANIAEGPHPVPGCGVPDADVSADASVDVGALRCSKAQGSAKDSPLWDFRRLTPRKICLVLFRDF